MPHVEVEGETLLHRILWQTVERQLKNASKNPNGSFYDDLAAMVFASHALEAYLNFVGERLAPEFWKDERKHFRPTGFAGKILKVLELCQIEEPSKIERPYSTVWMLKALRDRIAHAKPERFSATRWHSANEEPDLFRKPLDGVVTHENALAAADDLKKFVRPIHEAARAKIQDVGLGTEAFGRIVQRSTGSRV